MKFYPHHIGDFNGATRHLTRLERSVYRDLLDLYYDTEQPLTLDKSALCRRILARSDEESTAVEQVLNEFFNETSTGWYHSRCEIEIAAYRANTSQKSMAGKASAEAKRLKKLHALNGSTTSAATHVQQPLNSVATEAQRNSTNQEPITNNQEDKREDNARKTRAKRSPPSFEPPDWINMAHWKAWHSCKKRKNATVEQMQAAVDKLAAWRDSGEDFAGALENSAVGGWQGLFLPDRPTSARAQQETFAERDERNAFNRVSRLIGREEIPAPGAKAAGRLPAHLDIIDQEPPQLGLPS